MISDPNISDATAAQRRFHWRRLFQYSLRTLLVVVALFAGFFAWWSNSARQQRDAVAALRYDKQAVWYDFDGPLGKGAAKLPYWPTWLIDMLGVDYFANVTEVWFTGHGTDSSLKNLEGLRALQVLRLNDIQVTDAGLHDFKELKALHRLEIENSQVTDTGLEQLKGLTSLTMLDIGGTRVTDAGVARLQQALPNCEIER